MVTKIVALTVQSVLFCLRRKSDEMNGCESFYENVKWLHD